MCLCLLSKVFTNAGNALLLVQWTHNVNATTIPLKTAQVNLSRVNPATIISAVWRWQLEVVSAERRRKH